MSDYSRRLFVVVGLVTYNSNLLHTARAASELRKLVMAYRKERQQPEDKARSNRPPRNLNRRFTDEQIQELVVRYNNGSTSIKLAAENQVSKSSLVKLLKSNGAMIRQQPMSESNTSRAVSLYAQGHSLSQIAGRLEITQEVIRRKLIQAGTVMRSNGRDH